MQPRPTLYRVFGLEGEYDRAGMRDLIRRGEVTSMTEVAVVASDEWKTAGFYPELQHYLGLAAQKNAAEGGGATPRTKPLQILGFIALMAIGVFFTIGGGRDVYRGAVSGSWPTAEVRLIDATVVRSTYSRRSRRTRLRVRYAYQVGGRNYQSRTFAFGQPWFISERNTVRRLRNARPLLAHHHPRLHSIAVLETGITTGAALRLIGGLAALAAGIAVLVKPEIASRVLRATRGLRRSRASAA